MGGCINGQVITWDLSSAEQRVGDQKNKDKDDEKLAAI